MINLKWLLLTFEAIIYNNCIINIHKARVFFGEHDLLDLNILQNIEQTVLLFVVLIHIKLNMLSTLALIVLSYTHKNTPTLHSPHMDKI